MDLQQIYQGLTKLNDPFWIADEYITEQKLPEEIAKDLGVPKDIITSLLDNLGLWEEPSLIFPPNRECNIEDEEVCHRFLSWFMDGELVNVSRINQKGNKITVFFHLDRLYSNGRQVAVKRKHYRYHVYYSYLKSKKWKEMSARLVGSRKVCDFCGSTNRLCCHHLTYDRLGDEQDEDLQVLCWKCHTQLHRRNDERYQRFYGN